MMRELQDLERAHPELSDPNSPSVRVGSDITSEFRSVKHRFPMLSLGNTYITMAKQNTTKKHIVTSFHNLTPELQDAVKEKYPLGFTEAMMRVDKPNGDFFYAVPFDTDEIAYMVKIDVKIDDNAQEEDDKDYYDDEIKGADEIQDDANSDDGGGDSDDDVNI